MAIGINEMIAWAPLIAAFSALIIALISAFFSFNLVEFQKKKRVHEFTRLISAELMNLERHCRTVFTEADNWSLNDLASVKFASYKQGSMILFDPREAYILNENLCHDLMQVLLLSRNNDILIQLIVDDINSGKIADTKSFKTQVSRLKTRMAMTAKVSSRIFDELKGLMSNTARYNDPTVKWFLRNRS